MCSMFASARRPASDLSVVELFEENDTESTRHLLDERLGSFLSFVAVQYRLHFDADIVCER
jgi:hypothetical protein